MRRFAVSLLVLGAVTACKRSTDAPPCAAVGAKLLILAKDDLENKKPDEELGRAVAAQLPAMRDSIVAACTESAWSAAVRTCLVDANDHIAFEACEQQLTDAQRAALDRAARDESSAEPTSK